MSPPRPINEVITPETFDDVQDLKAADRLRLQQLPPDEAQRLVDSILFPKLWKLRDPIDLDWPGDLADECD